MLMHNEWNLLAFDGSHTGKDLTFNGFKHSTSTSGDIAYFVGQSEFVDCVITAKRKASDFKNEM